MNPRAGSNPPEQHIFPWKEVKSLVTGAGLYVSDWKDATCAAAVVSSYLNPIP